MLQNLILCLVGPVKNVRILVDKETGKSRGYAFVEYYDANAALSAIKNLDGAEVNGRKIKVSFPSQRCVSFPTVFFSKHDDNVIVAIFWAVP